MGYDGEVTTGKEAHVVEHICIHIYATRVCGRKLLRIVRFPHLMRFEFTYMYTYE